MLALIFLAREKLTRKLVKQGDILARSSTGASGGVLGKAKITFLGGGNMASSIIGGLLETNQNPGDITVSDPNLESLARLKQQFRINTTSSNTDAVSHADVVLLAVKPQLLADVCAEISDAVPDNALIISIAAGISSKRISDALGSQCALVRCMPNTPALVKQAASALYANQYVNEQQKQLADDILAAVGLVSWIEDEILMDAVTAVSGSGPAYFFLVIEAMIDAGVELGLERDLASALATQTAFGAALLAKNSSDDVAELRRKVTSPKGTTERAIESFEKNQLRDIFSQAMKACALRSQELGNL